MTEITHPEGLVGQPPASPAARFGPFEHVAAYAAANPGPVADATVKGILDAHAAGGHALTVLRPAGG